jgi:hemoglobin
MTQSMLDQLGGEDALKELVEHFYDLVESLPETHQLRKLHNAGHGFAHSREEQFNFLSGFMGGRQYYREKHRHMDVRLIHEHVPIEKQDAEVWLQTMDKALDALNHQGSHIDRLRQAFHRVAMMLVNDGKEMVYE